MTEETIKISADIKDAQKKIEDLTGAVEDLTQANKESQQEIAKMTKATTKQQNKLVKIIKGVASGFKGVGLAMKAAGFAIIMKVVDKLGEAFMSNQKIVDLMSEAFETITIVLRDVSNIFIEVFENVSQSTGGFDALKKVLGGGLALAVNLVVGAIQGIVLGVQKAQLAWEESFLGDGDPEEIKRLNQAIEETQDKLSETGERIKQAGSDIADNFVEAVGEVGELAQGVAEGVTRAIEEVDVAEANSQAKRLVASKKNFELMALQQQRLVEEYDLAAEKQRQIRDDETKSIEERMAANEELGKILDKQVEAEKKTVQARIDAIQLEIAAKGESVELTNELYALNTELAAVEAKVGGFRSEQLSNHNALLKEQQELTQSAEETETRLGFERERFEADRIKNELNRLERMRTILEEEKKIELERLQNKIDTYELGTQARIDAENEYKERKQALDQEIAANEDAINAERSKNEIKWEELTEEQKMSIVSDGFKNLASILGEESAAGKAAAIAAATIDTFASATSAYRSLVGIPVIGPALATAAAGAAIAAGIANVKAITATKVPGDKGASASIPTPTTPAAPSTPPAFNVVGQGGTSQLASAIGGQAQQPVQAYVVANDVTTAQSLDRNILEGASI